nr:MAG TPA: hypothetical protein [Caudoviricetes sp.]
MFTHPQLFYFIFIPPRRHALLIFYKKYVIILKKSKNSKRKEKNFLVKLRAFKLNPPRLRFIFIKIYCIIIS